METTFFLSKKSRFWGKSLPLANILTTHHRKNELFLDFAARKFGTYRKSFYLCSVKMYVLTTPLSAGSKTLSPLLHLKVTSKGGFYFSYTLLKIRLKLGLQANPRLTVIIFFPLNINTSIAS